MLNIFFVKIIFVPFLFKLYQLKIKKDDETNSNGGSGNSVQKIEK
jgi:hypothetical protein